MVNNYLVYNTSCTLEKDCELINLTMIVINEIQMALPTHFLF